MVAIVPMDRYVHRDDMLAHLSYIFVGRLGETAVRVVGGLLLISAGNTAITDMISIQYLMARDGELPQVFQKLNRFGVPWLAALIASTVPLLVLMFMHDVGKLAALYAIGVVGAVAINVSLCALHPRLRRLSRKVPMMSLGVILLGIWVTLAYTKRDALIFVAIVMTVGLSARMLTRWFSGRRPRPSLLRQAIAEQLGGDALARPKLLLGTYGSEQLAPAALSEARHEHATLVVCFIRQVALSYKYESNRPTLDTDQAAVKTFSRYLDLGHDFGVPVLPVYDMGSDAAELLAETAAIYGCAKILIGTSRRGALYHLIKGHFQRRLEAILPPETQVQVISPDQTLPAEEPAPALRSV